MLPDDVLLHVLSFLSPFDTGIKGICALRSDIVWRLHTNVDRDCFVEYVAVEGLYVSVQAWMDPGVFGSPGAAKEKCQPI